MTDIEKEMISWSQFHEDTKELLKLLANYKGKIKGIVAISRGGLVPAAIVASGLNIKNIELAAINAYTDDHKRIEDSQNYEVHSLPNNAIKDMGENWLVIDELVDTGSTFSYLKRVLPKAVFCSVYTKDLNIEILKFHVKLYNKGTWLVFPWEEY